MGTQQLLLELPTSLPKDAYDYGERTSGETHGVVLTKPHVVGLILDLAGYLPERDLAGMSLLEPSCGRGAFLVQAVERLMLSVKTFRRDLADLNGAISAHDIDPDHVDFAREIVCKTLVTHGLQPPSAAALAKKWINCDDFLLAPQDKRFDFVVGNPPYVRIEQLSPSLQGEYRRRYVSIYDRADLYVAFIERGLNLLANDGVLSFICADRWILNKYGAPLRKLLSERFKVRAYIDLHSASPFDSDVIAYPSIFAISPGKTGCVHVGALKTASPDECAILSRHHRRLEPLQTPGVSLALYDSWFQGDDPWVISTPAHLDALRDLETRFAPIESTARVGIGVATGNDKVFIVDDTVDIEADRLVPLVMRDHIDNGRIIQGSKFVINVFGPAGRVVDLALYPRLRRYLDEHADQIKRRHVAQKNPNAWFRTIDRVYPELVSVPKLLIPDIAGSNEVVFEEGHYHPHHNLYFVTSDIWDVEVLGGLLSSRVALFFVWSYAVKMRGNYLRFQAQYLRRIRLPEPKALRGKLSKSIKAAFQKRDFAVLDTLALEAYGLQELPQFEFVDTRR